MTTYNGDLFLPSQLESIASQSISNWHLWISDDGSSDDTLEIIGDFKKKYDGKVTLLRGPDKGSDANFWSLILNPNIKSDYYAYADQDDIWNNNKLEAAVKKLEKINNVPSLYCSRTEIIDHKGISIGLSPLFKKKPSFNNALVQSIAGGNTMVFNQLARESLLEISAEQHITAHDWLTYQVITGVGGFVFYDSCPYVKYRQHKNNQIGSNQGLLAKLKRLKLLLYGQFKKWNDSNINILNNIRIKMTNKSIQELDHFMLLRGNYLYGLKNLLNLKIYRQTYSGQLALLISILIKKL